MEEEYIIKLKDEVRLIPKDQWDGKKDIWTARFIPFGESKYIKWEYDDNGNLIDIKKYPVIIGLVLDLENNEDSGYVYMIYEYEKGKYTYDVIRMIKSALRFDVMNTLRRKYVWDSFIVATTSIIDPEVLAEFKKIVFSIILGTKIYDQLKERRIEPQFSTKKYYYILYKYALKGILDYKTYIRITDLEEDEIIDINHNYIDYIKFRVELAYEKIKNRN